MNIIEWMNAYILGGEKIGATVFPVIDQHLSEFGRERSTGIRAFHDGVLNVIVIAVVDDFAVFHIDGSRITGCRNRSITEFIGIKMHEDADCTEDQDEWPHRRNPWFKV